MDTNLVSLSNSTAGLYKDVPSAWTKLYEQTHRASMGKLVELKLAVPVTVRPGEVVGFYIHSTLRSDRALVYDNQRQDVSYEDQFIKVMPRDYKRILNERKTKDQELETSDA